ncbi:hypothetical protein N752_19475 [Desulforamulus aquiferis]|nr:GDSL-type esterase/lipase family protein [Desulforamulus aquiferis]RYD03590.1 hypothetical protein N752_19475 [Desulforamulus aquiferis]
MGLARGRPRSRRRDDLNYEKTNIEFAPAIAKLARVAEARYEAWGQYVARYEEENKYLKHELGTIVFLGDSLTEFFPFEDLRQRYNIINRGIRMDALDDAMERLKPSVLDIKPHKVFIMLGTNDVCAYWLPPEEVVARYKLLLTQIQASLPGTPVIVQSVLLTTDKNYNEYIRPINEGLFKVCREMNLVFMDHNTSLQDGAGLAKIYTTDGIHLNKRGYQVLTSNINRYLASPVVVQYEGKLIFSRLVGTGEDSSVLVGARSFAQATGCSLEWSSESNELVLRNKTGELLRWENDTNFFVSADGDNIEWSVEPVAFEEQIYLRWNPWQNI